MINKNNIEYNFKVIFKLHCFDIINLIFKFFGLKKYLLFLFLFNSIIPKSFCQNWPNFMGPNYNCSFDTSDHVKIADHLNYYKFVWKSEEKTPPAKIKVECGVDKSLLPPGHGSSPIVYNNKVYIWYS